MAGEIDKVRDKELFSRGKRGIIYTAFYNGKKVAIKQKRPDSKAKGRIENEVKWLKVLNKKGIGPKLMFSGDDYFVYEFVEGDFIGDYFRKSSKAEVRRIIRDVFEQMYQLDKVGVNKYEMHHPVKHVIIEEKTKNPVLVDFERCRDTEKPKNVTQFCQFIASEALEGLFKEKGIVIDREKMRELAKKYKQDMGKESFENIIGIL